MEPPLVWCFSLPTGTHFLQTINLGKRGQEISLDGVVIVAPEGELAFTGPGGTLLQLQPAGDSWILLVDGTPIEASSSVGTSSGGDGLYTFLAPSTGATHQLQTVDMGG